MLLELNVIMEVKKNPAKIYLHTFNNQELKEFCKKYKIKGYANLKKDDLIELILKSLPTGIYDEFFKNIEKNALKSIISTVPKYFLIENPTKLQELRYDDKDHTLELIFKGFNWEILTFVKILNLNKAEEFLKFDLRCTCEYAKLGGLCSHFWTALIWFFQKYSLSASRWNRTPLPDLFLKLTNSLNFSSFQLNIKKKPTGTKNIEQFLKENLMGKTDFVFDDLDKLSISEIQRFFEFTNYQIPPQNQKKIGKKDLIQIIKTKFNEKEFSKNLFEFKKQFRISEAKKISVDDVKISWGPPLNCEVNLKMMTKSDNFVIHISIKNDKINHEDCHWIYHRNNFCEHLLAFFLFLAKEDHKRTLSYLENYIEK